MKHLVALISCLIILFSFQANGQIKLLSEYHDYSGRFCSNSLYMYSENLYFKEGGCEEKSFFSCGTYTNINDSICVFYETKYSDIIYLLDVEFINEQSNTNRFRCFYKTLDDSIVEAFLFNYTYEEAQAWQHSDTFNLVHDYERTFEERDSILAAIPWHGQAIENQKDLNETVYICMEAFEFVNGKKEVIKIEPNVSQVIIHVNLPFVLLNKAQNNTMKHSHYDELEEQNELEPQIVNLNTIYK